MGIEKESMSDHEFSMLLSQRLREHGISSETKDYKLLKREFGAAYDPGDNPVDVYSDRLRRKPGPQTFFRL